MTPKEKDKIKCKICNKELATNFECDKCYIKGFKDSVKQTKAKLREDIEKRINYLDKQRKECTIDDKRHNNLDFKGFCIECEGRTFAVAELKELLKSLEDEK